jgi:cytochrome c-type biogenesis protein CcmH/NrfG
MGLFTALVTLPLAPVRGVVWVADQVAQEADRQLHDPARLRGELLQLELDRDQGLIGEEEFTARMEELLERIAAARTSPTGLAGGGEEVDDG